LNRLLLSHLSTFLAATEILRPIMVFSPPEWVPKLPFDPPDSIPISDFMLNEEYGRHPLAQSKPPFTCGITGTEYTALQVKDRVNFLARGLANEFGWHPNQGTEWEKVICVFSVNTVGSRNIALKLSYNQLTCYISNRSTL
jgi:hypothetical protein